MQTANERDENRTSHNSNMKICGMTWYVDQIRDPREGAVIVAGTANVPSLQVKGKLLLESVPTSICERCCRRVIDRLDFDFASHSFLIARVTPLFWRGR
jgi:hypothetical protein